MKVSQVAVMLLPDCLMVSGSSQQVYELPAAVLLAADVRTARFFVATSSGVVVFNAASSVPAAAVGLLYGRHVVAADFLDCPGPQVLATAPAACQPALQQWQLSDRPHR